MSDNMSEYYIEQMMNGFEDDTLIIHNRSFAIFQVCDANKEGFMMADDTAYIAIDPHMTIDGVGHGGWEVLEWTQEEYDDIVRLSEQQNDDDEICDDYHANALPVTYQIVMISAGNHYAHVSSDGKVFIDRVNKCGYGQKIYSDIYYDRTFHAALNDLPEISRMNDQIKEETGKHHEFFKGSWRELEQYGIEYRCILESPKLDMYTVTITPKLHYS